MAAHDTLTFALPGTALTFAGATAGGGGGRTGAALFVAAMPGVASAHTNAMAASPKLDRVTSHLD